MLNVDGILVIWIKERRVNEGKWGLRGALLNLALMNSPLFYHIVTPDSGASIYETTTGQTVWREAYSVAPASTFCVSLVDLFTDLENAVPRQLIK